MNNNTPIIIVVIVSILVVIGATIGIILGSKKKQSKEQERIKDEDTKRREKADEEERRKVEEEEKRPKDDEESEEESEESDEESEEIPIGDNIIPFNAAGVGGFRTSLDDFTIFSKALQPNYSAVYSSGINTSRIKPYKGIRTSVNTIIVGVDNTIIPFRMSPCVVSEFEPYITNYVCGNPNMTVVFPARPSILQDGTDYILMNNDVIIEGNSQTYTGNLVNNTYYFNIDITKLDIPSNIFVLPLQIDNNGYTMYSPNCNVTEDMYIELMKNINMIRRGTLFTVRYEFSNNPRIYIDHVNTEYDSQNITLYNELGDKHINLIITKFENNVHILSTDAAMYDPSYVGTYMINVSPHIIKRYMNSRINTNHLYNDILDCNRDDRNPLDKIVLTLTNDNSTILLNINIPKPYSLFSGSSSPSRVLNPSYIPAYTTLFNYVVTNDA